MAVDLFAPFGEDIKLGPGPDVNILGQKTTDFNFVTSQQELIQRVVRRLLTSKGSWIPFREYGASLRHWVNEPLDQRTIRIIESDIIAQISQEPDVTKVPSPVVLFAKVEDGLIVTLQFYTTNNQPVNFSFNPNTQTVLTNPADVFASIGRIRG